VTIKEKWRARKKNHNAFFFEKISFDHKKLAFFFWPLKKLNFPFGN
jgi:hypothetical protein